MPFGGPEESVTLENISRSGLCFTSLGSYTVGETIQVTLRPAGAAAPVIQSATIVRVSPAADGNSFYGARLETLQDLNEEASKS
jgi:PilZ domain